MIFIPNQDNKKLKLKVGKGVELEKSVAEKLVKAKLGIIKAKKKGRRKAK